MIYIDSQVIRRVFIPRKADSYKGDFGHTLVIAGSLGMVGAGFFSSMGAVRVGSGLTTLACFKECFQIFCVKLNEVMIKDLEDPNFLESINNFSSIVFGPGIGIGEKQEKLLVQILKNYTGTLIIDADGLTLLSKNNNLALLKERKSFTILTPHYGEFSKLINLDIPAIKNSRLRLGVEFANEYGCILLLKDHRTLISDGNKIYINTTGNSSMATGGMGDVLAGMIGAFVSQNYNPLQATVLATFFHGKAGDDLAQTHFCVTPTDILDILPKTIKKR